MNFETKGLYLLSPCFSSLSLPHMTETETYKQRHTNKFKVQPANDWIAMHSNRFSLLPDFLITRPPGVRVYSDLHRITFTPSSTDKGFIMAATQPFDLISCHSLTSDNNGGEMESSRDLIELGSCCRILVWTKARGHRIRFRRIWIEVDGTQDSITGTM